MNEQDYLNLLETAWRRPLTPAEEAELQLFLSQHPAAQAPWEEDQALNVALSRLPPAPVSSNFTSLVLQAVEQDAREEARMGLGKPRWFARWRPWAPRLAWGAVLIVAGTTTYWQFQAASQQRLVQNLDSYSTVMAAAPAPEMLQDFEEINRLSQVASVGDEALIEFLR